MARKTSPDKKAQFLDSALKLFAANGVQNTSTAAIAREAGTAAGTLFLYFPTKQDLLHALVLEIGRQQSEYIQSRLRPDLSVEQTFFTIWEGSVLWFQEHMEAYQYVQQVRDTGWITEAVTQESARSLDYYYHAIQKGLVEGRIKAYPLELIGEMLYRDIVAVMNLVRAQPEQAKQEEYMRTGFRIFWDGIKAAGN